MGTHSGPRSIGNVQAVIASGGTETVIEQDGKFYRVHSFTDVGSDTFEVLRGGEVEYLVVAGGGGSSDTVTDPGTAGATGGAGAGGFRKWVEGESGNSENGPLALPAGDIPVGVGLGGIGGFPGTKGENSYIGAILESLGGGVGRRFNQGNVDGVSDGGSGGGPGGRILSSAMEVGEGTPGQGNDSGARAALKENTGGAGGGGAGEKGQDTQDSPDGNSGGAGLPSSISGSQHYYSGGGAGGRMGGAIDGQGGIGGGGDSGQPGATNTGGGAGGANRVIQGGSNDVAGQNGGSGVVIVRYRITKTEFTAST